MQTDTRLIQNISDSYQSGADLRSETNPLRLAAGQCAGRPPQRQIIQTDFHQKADSGTNFPYNLCADHFLLSGQLQIFHKLLQITNGKIRYLINVFILNRNGKRFFFQSLSPACFAGRYPHKLFILLLHRIRTCLAVSAPDIFYQPFK